VQCAVVPSLRRTAELGLSHDGRRPTFPQPAARVRLVDQPAERMMHSPLQLAKRSLGRQ
jgi:hypothetical protein